MIKLTDFNAAVDTYKKNFLIRKKRFKNTQAQASVQKRAKRENRIEISKFAKRVGGGFAKKFKPAGGGDFLNDLLRFAGFTVLGLIVANIDKISIALKNTIEKIKEVANDLRIFYEEKVKPFFETVYNSAKSAYVAISGISNFFIDVNPLREFSDLLDTVMYGILATGYKMGSLNEPKAPKKPPGGAPRSLKSRVPVKTPVPAQTPAKTPAKTTAPARVITKTFARNPLVTAGKGTGTGTGTGVPKGTTAAGMLADDLKNMLQGLSDDGIKALADDLKDKPPKVRGPYSELPAPPPKGQLTVNQILGRAIGGDISRLMQFYRKGNFSISDLVKIANDIEGESFNERQAAYRLLQKKNLAYKVTNIPDASQYFTKPIDRTPEGKLQQSKFFAPDIPKPKVTQTLSTYEKLQSQFKYLTKGLDFRVDLKTPILNAIKNPKQFALNAIGGGLRIGGNLLTGFIIDGIVKWVGKTISDSLPYDPKFKTLGYFGLISKERIAATTAQEILDRDADQQVIAIDKLIKAAESTPAFYDLSGQQKKESARAILDAIIKIRASEQKTTKEKLEENAEKIDEALQSRTPLTPELLSQTISFGTNIAFGKQEPSSNTTIAFNPPSRLNTIAQGLDQETTYSNQGMVTIKETLIAIQPIEVPAA